MAAVFYGILMEFLIGLTRLTAGEVISPYAVTGAIIEQMGSAKLIEGLVKLEVELRSPPDVWELMQEQQNYVRNAKKLLDQYAITPLDKAHHVPSITRLVQLTRLDIRDLTTKLEMVRQFDWISKLSDTRKKRGLVDIGGKWLKSIFGIATEEDIHTLSKSVNVIKEALKTTNYATLSLTELVQDQFRKISNKMTELNDRINNEKYLQSVFRHITFIRAQLQNIKEFIQHLIDLNKSINYFLKGVRKTPNTQLPESLFSFELLQQVDLDAETNMGLYSLVKLSKGNLTYFLDTCKVLPLHSPYTVLVLIPYTSRTQFNLYHFHSFPTRHPQYSQRVMLNVPAPNFLVSTDLKHSSTLSENHFKLCTHHLLPWSIFLCPPVGPIYEYSADTNNHDNQCLESIVRHKTLLNCKFSMFSSQAPVSLRTGGKIILSLGSPNSAILNCPGTSREIDVLQLVILDKSCSLSSDKFSLANFKEMHTNRTVNPFDMKTNFILFNAPYPEMAPSAQNNSLNLSVEHSYQQSKDIQRLLTDSNKLLTIIPPETSFIISGLSLSITVILSCLLAICIVYRKCKAKAPPVQIELKSGDYDVPRSYRPT